MSNRAWVTLATNDSYGLGALVLAHSLRRVGSAYPAVVLITPSVTEAMRDRLRAVFAEVVTVDVLDSGDAAHLALLQRPELGITFTKIHCWNLTQYDKCVFLDADALVVQNCDELFDREELSAAPDVGWPDCFNSGVFVYTPSADTFSRLVQFAQERGSFDGGDQGLLNSFFSDWAHGDISKHLPFLYNVTSAAFYSYMPALKHYGQNLKIIHFIGAAKPWLQHFNWESRAVDAPEHLRQFLQLWWDLFVVDVHAQLDVSMVEVEGPHHESTNEQPPELPPQDVSQHFHYQPVLDPESEFPWHRPDVHIEKDKQDQQIDMSDVFDPWDIYGGHIHPKHKELTSPQSEDEAAERSNLRKYVWEYYGQERIIYEKTHENNEQPVQMQQWDHRHFDSYQHNPEPPCIHVYNQTNYNQHPIQHEVQFEHHNYFSAYQEETSKQTDNHHEELPEQSHHNQEYLHNTNLQEEYSHHQSPNEYSIYTKHYDNLDNYPNNNHNNFQHINEQKHDNDFQNESYTRVGNSFQGFFNQLQAQHIYSQQYESNNITEEIQKRTEENHKVTEHPRNNFESNKPSTSTQQIKVHHGYVERDKSRRQRKTKTNTNVRTANEKVNGDVSNSENELEDIIPRHPYDGFYLRHRVTIDSRGRKICTHEIPPIPSPSSSESGETRDYFSAEEALSDFEDQSGVAGNLARVTLGSSQREAIDELTRRQGWEAGNIDYMGVDSFDNIWAKISQTLSQGRPSPPKQSPPREPVPPQSVPEQVEVVTGEIAQEPVTDPIELAKEVVPNEDTIPVQEPEVIQSAVSSETATFTTTTPTDTAAPASISADKDSPSAIQTQSVPEVPVESLPITTSKPVAESVTGIKPPATTEDPILTEVKPVAAEKAVEKSPIAEAPVADPTPVTVTDTVTAVVSQASEITGQPAVIEVPVSEIPVSVETVTSAKIPTTDTALEVEPVLAVSEEKTEALVTEVTPKEPVADPVKVLSADAKSQTEIAPAEVKEKIDTQVTETTPVAAPVPVPSAKTESQAEPALLEAKERTETTVVTSAPVEPIAKPVKVPSADTAPPVKPIETEVKEKTETRAPVEPVAETPKVAEPVQTVPTLPLAPPVCPIESTPEKSAPSDSASDSPPLANTPSKEEIPDVSAPKSAERRKPAGKLQLSPPVAPDPLPTPDSELEDAASLAQSIIASELRTPTVTSPGSATSPSSPPAPLQHSRLSVDEPEVPTPPVGAVSLAQIGVKTKGKTTTAAQIESSVSDKPESTTEPTTRKTETAPAEVPKKKIVKKVVKKVAAASGDTPVPPPRKKEKKPKE